MPQISPINWVTIIILVTLTSLIINIAFNQQTNSHSPNIQTPNANNNLNW